MQQQKKKIGQNHKFKTLSYCDFLKKLILGRLSAGWVVGTLHSWHVTLSHALLIACSAVYCSQQLQS